MDPERQREIASRGGRAAHASGNAHEWTSQEAREAGRRGGIAAHQHRNTKGQDTPPTHERQSNPESRKSNHDENEADAKDKETQASRDDRQPQQARRPNDREQSYDDARTSDPRIRDMSNDDYR